MRIVVQDEVLKSDEICIFESDNKFVVASKSQVHATEPLLCFNKSVLTWFAVNTNRAKRIYELIEGADAPPDTEEVKLLIADLAKHLVNSLYRTGSTVMTFEEFLDFVGADKDDKTQTLENMQIIASTPHVGFAYTHHNGWHFVIRVAPGTSPEGLSVLRFASRIDAMRFINSTLETIAMQAIGPVYFDEEGGNSHGNSHE